MNLYYFFFTFNGTFLNDLHLPKIGFVIIVEPNNSNFNVKKLLWLQTCIQLLSVYTFMTFSVEFRTTVLLFSSFLNQVDFVFNENGDFRIVFK